MGSFYVRWEAMKDEGEEVVEERLSSFEVGGVWWSSFHRLTKLPPVESHHVLCLSLLLLPI